MRQRMFVLCLIVMCVALVPVRAQAVPEDHAVPMRVLFDGAELKRIHTDVWLPLRAGSTMPVGAGDVIRTNITGRVMLQFDATTRLLLLPTSELRITTLTRADDQYGLVAQLPAGVLVQSQADGGAFMTYEMTLSDVVLTDPAQLMAMWSFADRADAIMVAQGQADILYDEGGAMTTLTVRENEGLRARVGSFERITLAPPLNEARLTAALDGCTGLVDTVDGEDLLIRDGAGRGFIARDLAPDGIRVPLLGRTESGQWTRTQYLSHYGWVLTLALEDTCEDLTVYPDLTQEPPQERAFNVTDDELGLLRPFYGTPLEDGWFYRYVTPDSPELG